MVSLLLLTVVAITTVVLVVLDRMCWPRLERWIWHRLGGEGDPPDLSEEGMTDE